MTAHPDLIKSILAMDAYNRGYNAGIGRSPCNNLLHSRVDSLGHRG